MAKLFDSIFSDTASCDVVLVVTPDLRAQSSRRNIQDDEEHEEEFKLWCHSVILSQHPYFFKMLQPEFRESRTREVHLTEPHDEFIELIRFIYTSQIDINRSNVVELLALGDKYCIDEVVDLCLKHVKDHFDADMFFEFFDLTTLSSLYRDKLNDQIVCALQQRRHFCSIIEDSRWCGLPLETVELILSHDHLPVTSEAEVLTLISLWLRPRTSRTGDATSNGGVSAADVARLLGSCRKRENMQVCMEDLEVVTQALGIHGMFSDEEPRTGSALWDPSFVVQRLEATAAAGPITLAPLNTAPQLEDQGGAGPTICHQLGPKDVLQQEPGWMHPGVYKCRVSISCTSWSHRERRLRGSAAQVAATWGSRLDAKPGHERSPSPPPVFQVRMPPRESAPVTGAGSGDASEQIDHQIILGVASGPSSSYQRRAVRISQQNQNAIYLVEDLNGKQSLNIGGTMSAVAFDVVVQIEEASKYDLRRCRFALLRNEHVLLEERFDTSAKVPVRFFITSTYFDKHNSYTVSVQWQRPPKQCRFFLEEQP